MKTDGLSKGNWRIRLGALILVVGVVVYIPWMLTHLNPQALWLAIPFAVANILLAANALSTAINNWQRAVPPERFVPAGQEPVVLTLVPTYGEPDWMVRRTAESVLRQDWPLDKLRLIISDDAHSAAILDVAVRLATEYPAARILYHRPPRHGTPERPGDAKAGNLNSALALGYAAFPEVTVVETRDADDEVGDRQFLRRVVAELLSDAPIAFVQTIKDARVSRGDPFGNREINFYHGLMLGKHAANAVFPCGSGLVWRGAALDAIGRFPIWNLVEDLQSGVEALSRGWRGSYVPIVGAVAQHAPEDIPNVYKQRGTWAIDTLRLLFWRGLRGLNWRQRLHFIEMGLFYLYGFSALLNLLSQAITLIFRIYPLEYAQDTYGVRFWVYALSIEAFLFLLCGRLPYRALWRMRQVWLGLAPVYVRAAIVALLSGPHRKPVYRVTRKANRFRWYWRETAIQLVLFVLLVAALLYHLATTPSLAAFEFGLTGWTVFHLVVLSGIVRGSWFGVGWRRAVTGATVERRLAVEPTPAVAVVAEQRAPTEGLD